MSDKQMDLFGNIKKENVVDENKEEISELKSALQKSIRQGLAEKAMYFAYQLAKQAGWWITWRRLRIIATEDCGQAKTIVAVESLYRQFLDVKGKQDELNWDAMRCIVCAAKILAESKKDRRADEFLELMLKTEQKNEEAVKWVDELKQYPDGTLDMHTVKGRKMGRGDKYFYEVSSRVENATEQYKQWKVRFNKVVGA
jgi:replication-associated recombination protein RarA